MSSVCFWLFLILISSVSSEDHRDMANHYIDKALDDLKNDKFAIKRIDPFNVPDIKEDNFEGKNIYIRGLSALHRFGNAELFKYHDAYEIQARIAVNNVGISLDYRAKAGLIWISGLLEAKLDRIVVYVHTSFDRTDGRGKLKEFKVSEFGSIHVVHVTGLSFMLNWLLRIIVNNMINGSRSRIINAVETEVGKIIAFQVKRVRFPV